MTQITESLWTLDYVDKSAKTKLLSREDKNEVWCAEINWAETHRFQKVEDFFIFLCEVRSCTLHQEWIDNDFKFILVLMEPFSFCFDELLKHSSVSAFYKSITNKKVALNAIDGLGFIYLKDFEDVLALTERLKEAVENLS